MADVEKNTVFELAEVTEGSDSDTEVVPSFSDKCLDSCPQLHQCVARAMLKQVVKGGDFKDLLNEEVTSKQNAGELPEICETGPTWMSSHRTRLGGTPVRLSGLTASTLEGLDGWNGVVATVCVMDAERLEYGQRRNAPFESDDMHTGLFTSPLRKRFYEDDR